jgi:2-keto-3-deoxy-L-rhamnonate aldolase RhmA
MNDRDESSLPRRRLAGGDALQVIWLSLGSVAVAEIAARAGPDAVVLDLQHGLWDRTTLEAAVGIATAHCPVLVRVEENSPVAIGRALDSGASGVIVPLVESAGEAAAAVSAARFPPEGSRSGGGVRPLATGFGAYLEAARETLVAVMIETAAGVDAAEAIAATPGVDMVLIGTGDLGLSYAHHPDAAERRESGCARVLAACSKAGIAAGIFTMDLASARARRAEGYRMVVLANDIETVRAGFAAAVPAAPAD